MPGPADFALVNARAVLPDDVHDAAIVVRAGTIHRLECGVSASTREIDCEGDYLLPGLVDLHTDNLERHIEPRPGIFWNADRAVLSHDAELAAAGITTAFDAITLGGDTGERARESAHLSAITSIDSAESSRLLRVQHRLHLRCELGSPNLADHFMAASARRTPHLVSLMEHVPGAGQWRDVVRFREHYSRRYGLSDVELDALIARRQLNREKYSSANREFVIEQVSRHACVLASHDDALVHDVDVAQQSGCEIAEFPTSIEAARDARRREMLVVAGAPNLVRGGSHSGNVAASSLATEGLIDILASDYCPSSLLQAVFLLARIAEMPLAQAVVRAAANPARSLGLSDRGALEEGRRADLVRVRDTASGPIVISAWCAGRQVA